jgi:type IV pilus assembly protein PilE
MWCAVTDTNWRAVRRAHAGGFTLIELMIAVAIVAILTATAYPAYEEHLRKGRRAAAQTFMLHVADRQHQYLFDARAYAVGAAALATLGVTVPPEVARFYAVTVTPDAPESPPAFTVLATPLTGSAQVPDGTLTLSHIGAKTRNGREGW